MAYTFQLIDTDGEILESFKRRPSSGGRRATQSSRMGIAATKS